MANSKVWRAILWLSLALLTACNQQAVSVYKLAGETMGTQYHITVNHGSPVDVEQLQGDVDRLLVAINQSMSTYIPDSELNQLNRAEPGNWVEISDGLYDVLLLSVEMGWLSGGAFDITLGPLIDLWGFGAAEATDQIPSDGSIETILESIGFDKLELDLNNSRVKKSGAIEMNLSAVAKGWAVDRVAELLKGYGYSDFLVEIGGEIQVSGESPRGGPWRLAIESPQLLVGEVHRAVSLSNGGIATSGDYRNYFEVDGKRYSHTLDPRTGRPINHKLASVTVIDDSTGRADALATALNVLGSEVGLKLAEELGVAAYMIVREEGGFESRYSSAFERYLNPVE